MKTTLFLIIITLLVAFLLISCNGSSRQAIEMPEDMLAGELSLMEQCEYQPADSKTKYLAECGILVVPENWDKDGSRLIALPIVRVPAKNGSPAEPVFYLQGGPGQSNLSWGPPDWLLANHDVVFVGYRGIDGTVNLACPDVNRVMKTHAGKDLISEQARKESVIAVKQCAAAYQAAGVDISGYTIPGVVKDLESARAVLGYDRINLLSESYGTRVAQIYAYLHPESLHRLVLIGVNTPGHFVWDPFVLDRMIAYISELCDLDRTCSNRTQNLARTMYEVNHNMPERWLFFNIDPDSVRLGTQFIFLSNLQMPMVLDAYLAAGEGDPSGLAMLNLLLKISPIDQQVFGDQASKAGTVDLENYDLIANINLDETIMGAPMTEWIWPIAKEWPIQLISQDLRDFQQSDVEMLLVNGTIDFSTPPTALDEAKPYYHNSQMVLLPEFSHIVDVMTLQPEAFELLITSFYDSGTADASRFVYQPLAFKPGVSLAVVARLLVVVMILLPALLILGIVLMVRRFIRFRRLRVHAPESFVPNL